MLGGGRRGPGSEAAQHDDLPLMHQLPQRRDQLGRGVQPGEALDHRAECLRD